MVEFFVSVQCIYAEFETKKIQQALSIRSQVK